MESGLCTSQKLGGFWQPFAKFNEVINRFKNYVAWICLVEILIGQPCQSFCQSIELPTIKSSARLVYCGNEIRNLFTVSDFDWMTSDNPDVGRMAEQFNLRFPLLQKSDEIKPSIFFGCFFRFFSVLSLASSCERASLIRGTMIQLKRTNKMPI